MIFFIFSCWIDVEAKLGDFANRADVDYEVEEGLIFDSAVPGGVAFEGQALRKNYVNTNDTLYIWEPPQNYIEVGSFSWQGQPVEDVTDIAIDLQGQLFAVTDNMIFSVNAETAELELEGTVSRALVGLAFLSTGELVGAGDGVYLIDKNSFEMEPLIPSGRYQTSGDIVGHPNGNLYWTVQSGTGNLDDFVEISGTQTTFLGTLSTSFVWGLGMANEQIYGFSATGEVHQLFINGDNQEVQSSTQGWWGAATNPIWW
ncbi:MAG: hypothetical protein CMK59_01915 [Proteobacteria bacterium]|nr:hypothetical protein [Pseudomonadota bacterium]|tara:strand:+ start:70 stop:843 length:774 start_codon:yes stop_codon:yes gene_type:complete